jgi:Coenzyme PQQ synthesis protein D (PqqD)
MTRMDKKPKRAADARVRKVRGQVLVAGNTDVYELSEEAAAIWDLADGTHSVTEIATALSGDYDVTFETALRDVQALLAELTDARLAGMGVAQPGRSFPPAKCKRT